MVTRIRPNLEKLFDLYLEISVKQEPVIEVCIPEKVEGGKKTCTEAMCFCLAFLPSALDCRYGSQFYVFVQTESDSKFKFGFCCYSPLDFYIRCFISYNPFFTIFHSCLSSISLKQHDKVTQWIYELYKISNIIPTQNIEVSLNSDDVSFTQKFYIPDLLHLPVLDNSINISMMIKKVDTNHIIQLFIAAIFERRIIVTSHKISLITAVIHSLSSLIYPLAWENIFIPLIPNTLIDYLEAPMPFIIGIHKSNYIKTQFNTSEIVLMDLDENKLNYPLKFEMSDNKAIGSGKIAKLSKKLTKQTNPETISEIFLNFQANIFGHYPLCLMNKRNRLSFDKEKFLEIPQVLGFKYIGLLKHLIQSQSFSQFIDYKITNYKNGKCDAFDILVEKVSAKIKDKLINCGFLDLGRAIDISNNNIPYMNNSIQMVENRNINTNSYNKDSNKDNSLKQPKPSRNMNITRTRANTISSQSDTIYSGCCTNSIKPKERPIGFIGETFEPPRHEEIVKDNDNRIPPLLKPRSVLTRSHLTTLNNKTLQNNDTETSKEILIEGENFHEIYPLPNNDPVPIITRVSSKTYKELILLNGETEVKKEETGNAITTEKPVLAPPPPRRFAPDSFAISNIRLKNQTLNPNLNKSQSLDPDINQVMPFNKKKNKISEIVDKFNKMH